MAQMEKQKKKKKNNSKVVEQNDEEPLGTEFMLLDLYFVDLVHFVELKLIIPKS